MPTNIRIIHTRDFIRAKPDGILDLSASRSLLKDLVTQFDTAGRYRVLVDLRGAEVRLSTIEIYQVGVAVASETALAHEMIALLAPPEKKVDVGFFESVSRNRGALLRAFTEFETAITWLITKEQP